MRRLIFACLAGLALASLPLASASAQRAWRGRDGHHRHYGHYYYHHHYYRDDGGAALGAGLLAGALLGGALAASQPPPPPPGRVYMYPPDTRLGYCERQLPGFDAATGTYIAPNGRRVPCP